MKRRSTEKAVPASGISIHVRRENGRVGRAIVDARLNIGVDAAEGHRLLPALRLGLVPRPLDFGHRSVTHAPVIVTHAVRHTESLNFAGDVHVFYSSCAL